MYFETTLALWLIRDFSIRNIDDLGENVSLAETKPMSVFSDVRKNIRKETGRN